MVNPQKSSLGIGVKQSGRRPAQAVAAAAQFDAGRSIDEMMWSFSRMLGPVWTVAALSIAAPGEHAAIPASFAHGLQALQEEWEALFDAVLARESDLLRGCQPIPPVVLHLLASAAFNPTFPCTGLELTEEQARACYKFLETNGFDYFDLHQRSREERAAAQERAR